MKTSLLESMTFSEKLKQLAEAHRYSQADLARIADVSPSLVSKWMKGTLSPDMKVGLLLARALEVPLDYLADDEMDQPPRIGLDSEEERLLWTVSQLPGGVPEAMRRILEPPEIRGVGKTAADLIRDRDL